MAATASLTATAPSSPALLKTSPPAVISLRPVSRRSKLLSVKTKDLWYRINPGNIGSLYLHPNGCMECSPPSSLLCRATENDQSAKNPQKVNSILCKDCEGNGAILCTQCKGSGVNSVDHFNGRFKAGALCWLCRGKREILCGSCNGAGFLGGFLSTFDETAE
ncbi:protein BUNDLE SHEATH DEFECTIVE 2, chloroplastic-like isoform X1 [Phragmites australis]|uniref:protein BUNDLE SHEATH DEFECTIVE 2, chloroplastic-like isoform X1 n=1 Tax=Phragmites australis TaxID=29695 RepID=UPI002D790438|nr:protein BUNDLE SHEATH DEFECTIVE 2, chloroplastic-like isoform X1 [Phragmites australis]